jgi:hypothetical protein
LREGRYNATQLEQIAEQTRSHKAKALQARAAISLLSAQNAEAVFFYQEALKARPSVSEYVDSIRSIAGLKATEGLHSHALEDLKAVLPMLSYCEDIVQYNTLNSYAVELTEAGQLTEAENVGRLVLASRYAPFYPEWHETYKDIQERFHRRRSFVAPGFHPEQKQKQEQLPEQEQRNVVPLVRSSGSLTSSPPPGARLSQPARILEFSRWQDRMLKKKMQYTKPAEVAETSRRELLMKLLDYITTEDLPDAALEKMVFAVEAVMKEYGEAESGP